MAQPRDSRDVRLLILAPRGRDASLAREALKGANLTPHVCPALPTLVRELTLDAVAIVVSEAAILPQRVSLLTNALADQPSWSELPIVVLMPPAALDARPQVIRHFEQLRNMTMLDRPVRIAELASTIHAALRARR